MLRPCPRSWSRSAGLGLLLALVAPGAGCSSTGSGGDPPPPARGMRMAPAAAPTARRAAPAPDHPREPMSASRAADAGVSAAPAVPAEVERLRDEARRRPDDAAVRLRLAGQLVGLGALGEAEVHLQWLRGLPAHKAAATALLCRARRIVNRAHDGVRICREAAQLLPKDADVHRELGLMLLIGREHGNSLAALQQAVALAPGWAENQRALGWLLLQLHRPKPALVPLAEAVRLAPGDPYARTLLGDALWATAQTRHAEVAYRQAAAMTTGAPVYRAEALDKLGTLWASRGLRAKAEALLKACESLYPYLGCPYTKVALLPANPDRIPGSEPVRPYRDVPPDPR